MERRKKILVANWKSTRVPKKNLLSIVRASKKVMRKYKGDLIFCPPFPYIESVKEEIGRSSIDFGAQTVSSDDSNRQTGEVTAQILFESGVSYCIVGHSERGNKGETLEDIKNQVSDLISHKIHPIICVGEKENIEDVDDIKSLIEVNKKLFTAVEDLSQKDAAKCIIAYEPEWAIGQKVDGAIDEELLHQRILYIRKILKECYGRNIAFEMPVLYGGSVKPENVLGLWKTGVVDGFLIGSASTNKDQFIEIMSLMA